MATLARCEGTRLDALWNGFGIEPEYRMLRGPDTGLVMLRGRVGGTGNAFNIGEATVTRATVRLGNGAVGHSMALGQDHAKARISAIIDALCHDSATASRIDAEIIAPLRRDIEAGDGKRRAEAAATKVDFFTMVRGED
jgi:alpha-D-ribose 1-methylphosphonate 5-triphosphate synthase subunit PhnG